MLGYQINEYYNFTLGRLNFLNNETELNSIREFADKIEKIFIEVNKSIIGSSRIESQGSQLKYLPTENKDFIQMFRDEIISFKERFNAFSCYGTVQQIKLSFNEYYDKNRINTEKSDIKILFNKLDEVFETYQKYIQTRDNMVEGVIFGNVCIEYIHLLDQARYSYECYISLSEATYKIEDEEMEEKVLDIQLLDIRYSFNEFTNILSSINRIYEKLGDNIYRESIEKNYQDLEIIKIESGSLLSKIFGDKNIIEALGLLLTKTVNLIFNKFTLEGRVYRHRELMDELKQQVEFAEKLGTLGYDVTSCSEEIEGSFAIITKELLKIISSSTKIKIDKQEFSIGDELIKKNYLENTSRLRLETTPIANEEE